MNKIFGTVTGFKDGYFQVACEDVPFAHLQFMNLTPRQAAGAGVGDKITLEYRTTRT